MLTDSLWNFTGDSPGQAITASAASTNYVDLGALGVIPGLPSGTTPTRDLGKGTRIPILIQVTETFATLTSLKVAIQTDSDSGFATALTTVLETEAIVLASLTAGYQYNIDFIPPKTIQRYLRLYFTVAGSNATAGKVFASSILAKQDSY
jgi:hypothetical protein